MFLGMEFCRRLRNARKKAGYTMEHAAQCVYLSRDVIANYESGRTIPPIDRVAAMASLYAVSIDWLCGMEVVK